MKPNILLLALLFCSVQSDNITVMCWQDNILVCTGTIGTGLPIVCN
jgi:hypothetical protein